MNKLTATILSTISLSGAALIAAALFSSTSAHSAPVATGDVAIGSVTVVEELPGSSSVVLPEVVVTPRMASKARPFEMTHVSRVASNTVVVHPAAPRDHYTFDVDVSL
jgi:hypothetical protein